MKRRRGEELERAILQAAAEQLSSSGYAGMTMDSVARRAGTNKNAIYRRWPQRVDLAVDAYARLADAADTTVPDGSLRDGALELLRRANATWSSPHGAILRDLFAAASDDPALLARLRRHAAAGSVTDTWLQLLERAGDADAGAVHPRVAALPMTLLRGEYALRGVPGVPDEVLVEIVDEIFLPLVRGRRAVSDQPGTSVTP
ncbi:TetR/AcrR family transcriptional regulator [Microbacterium sp. NPDC058342]|uniref:TetR/AcrR family transcriptional regulator n=1 Tax=Microbacterium sp. NPDC058342 TaxID=3346454 RepID=UPI00365A71C0